jgi:hypothetical protein
MMTVWFLSESHDAIERAARTTAGHLGRDELRREWHPMSYVENLILHILEWKRILTPDGNLYLNLGDVYFGTKGFS